MYDTIDSGNFSVEGYLPLIQKDFITHMDDLAVYVKEGLRFTQDLSLENSEDSYYVFDQLYLTQCFLFLLSITFFILMHIFCSVSSSIDQVEPSTVFVFGDFNVYHKDWLTYFGGNDRPDELCYNELCYNLK